MVENKKILLAEKHELNGRVAKDETTAEASKYFSIGIDEQGEMFYNPEGNPMIKNPDGTFPPTEKYVADEIAKHNTAPDAHFDQFQAVFNEISKLGSVLNYKGSKKTYAELPIVNKVGDVWYIEERSTGYVWIEKGEPAQGAWEEFGPTIDLSGYATKVEVNNHINNKNNPHSVTAVQTGAIPSSEKGQVSGVAALDKTGKVPLDQLHPYTNPNLLDNWYFGNPVNQRVFSSYTDTMESVKPTVDRWKTGWHTALSLTPPSGMIFKKGDLSQPIENAITDSLIGESVTLSMLYKENGVTKIDTISGTLTLEQSLTGELVEMQWYSYGNYKFAFIVRSHGRAITSIATKLELGSQQTLAHQENGKWVLNEIPDYGQELLKCQRYFQTFEDINKRPDHALDYRPVMRKTNQGTDPAHGTIPFDGKTLYTANAEL